MFGLGIGEIVVIAVIALIFIGPKKLPGLAKGLGKGIREFQNAVGGISDQIKNPTQHTDEIEQKPLQQDDHVTNEPPTPSDERQS